MEEQPEMSRVIAVANHKGGTGKTTSTLAIGTALAERGRRVLIVDLDPQASLTTGAGTPADHMTATGGLAPAIQRYLAEGELQPIAPLIYTIAPGLDILPTDRRLRGVELTLAGVMGRERVIADHLATLIEAPMDADGHAGAHDLYDTILLDCPPGQGLMVVNALVAATHVLIPVSPEYPAVEGMRLFLSTLAEARRARLITPRLAVSGVLLTRVDESLTDQREQIGEIHATIDPRNIVVIGSIKERTVVNKAAAAHRSVLAYAPKSDVADAYRDAASTLLDSWGGAA